MRTDFREERRWKLALAYHLSTAVLEWHAAGSSEERVAKGICVKWKPPSDADDPMMDEETGAPDAGESMDVDGPQANVESQKNSILAGDYGSDDDDDDEQDKQSVVDPLDPEVTLQEAIEATEEATQNQMQKELKDVQPKTEDIEDPSVLQNVVDANGQESSNVTKAETTELPSTGLKDGSIDPTLGDIPVVKSSSQSSAGEVGPSVSKTKASKINLYAPLRDRIIYSDASKLFLDLDDFRLAGATANSATGLEHPNSHLPPADLTSIFPDLQPFGIFEPTVQQQSDGKKKSEKRLADDSRMRVDEADKSKIWPVGSFMLTKPTLLSALQPSAYFTNGQWVNREDFVPISVDSDVFPKVPDDCTNGKCIFNYTQ